MAHLAPQFPLLVQYSWTVGSRILRLLLPALLIVGMSMVTSRRRPQAPASAVNNLDRRAGVALPARREPCGVPILQAA